MASLAGLFHRTGRGPSKTEARAFARHHSGKPGTASGGMVFIGQAVDCGDVVVQLDGWIDDQDDLIRRTGNTPAGQSPEQALALAWKKWGTRCFDRMDGEFCVALWEPGPRRLTLARDRMGSRPLYWTRREQRVAFATSLADLLELPWVERTIARDYLSEYLAFGTVHAPRTLAQDIFQIEPAHWLRVDVDDLTTRRWWRPHYAKPGTPVPRPSDVVPALQDAVERSVSRRLRPGLRPALYLSGGLGSTAIAAAARTLGRTLPSFTVALSDDPHPESPFAGRIAKLLQLDHRETIVESRDVVSAFDTAAAAMGQPVAAASAVLLQLLAEAASYRADVVFSGDGSEELFGGRMLDGLSRSLTAAQVHAQLPSVLRTAMSPLLSRSARGRRMQTTPASWGLEQGLGGANLFSEHERRALFVDKKWVHESVRRDVLAPFYADNNTDPINAILHAWMRSRLMEGALPRTGRTTAASGLDARYPLLDREVVSLATALPGRAKVGRGLGSLHTRWPLRSMLTGVLPPPLLNRPKRSLPLLHGWLAKSGRLFMEERLVEVSEASHGLFERRALMTLRRRVGEDAGAAQRLWALFFLQRWIDVHKMT